MTLKDVIAIGLMNFKDWKRYDVRRRILRMGILITGFLSIMIAIFTFYGQFSGNFVMSVTPDSYRRGILLSTDKEFLIPTSRLNAKALSDASDITYSWINIDKVKQTDGEYIDPSFKYLAYSFYLKNIGEETVAVSYTIDIRSVHLGVDEAIRILLISDDSEVLYQKPDSIPFEYGDMPQAVPFIDETRVCQDTINSFRPNQIKRYSVLLWIEGEDPDCTERIKGGQIKMHMNFKIVGS